MKHKETENLLAGKTEVSWKLRSAGVFHFIQMAANQITIITDVYLGTQRKGNTRISNR